MFDAREPVVPDGMILTPDHQSLIVALYDPGDAKAGAATRVGRRLNDQGKLVRFSKKSGEEIK